MRILLIAGLAVAAFAQTANVDLSAAAKKGDLVKVTALLKAGADVNSRTSLNSNTSDKTPLMWASAYGHLKTVEALVAGGARLGEKDAQGGTALLYGRAGSHDDVIKFLEGKGATAPEMSKLESAMWILGQGAELSKYFGERARAADTKKKP
jgi:ankyrin repeat protein